MTTKNPYTTSYEILQKEFKEEYEALMNSIQKPNPPNNIKKKIQYATKKQELLKKLYNELLEKQNKSKSYSLYNTNEITRKLRENITATIQRKITANKRSEAILLKQRESAIFNLDNEFKKSKSLVDTIIPHKDLFNTVYDTARQDIEFELICIKKKQTTCKYDVYKNVMQNIVEYMNAVYGKTISDNNQSIEITMKTEELKKSLSVAGNEKPIQTNSIEHPNIYLELLKKLQDNSLPSKRIVTPTPSKTPVNPSFSLSSSSFKNMHNKFAPAPSSAPLSPAPASAPPSAAPAPPSPAPNTVLQTTQHDPPANKPPTNKPPTNVPPTNDPPAAYLVIQTDTNGELVHDTMPVGSTLKPLTDRQTMYLISVSDPKNKDSYTIKTRVSGEKSVENLRKELNKVPLPPRNIQRTTAELVVVKAQTVLQNKINAFLKQEKNVRTTGAYDATISSAQSVVDAATDAKEKTQRLLDILQTKKNNKSVKSSIAVAQHEIKDYESVLIDYKQKIHDLQQNKKNTASFTGTPIVNPTISTSNEAVAFARGIGGKRRTTVRRQPSKRAVKRSSRK